MLGRHETVKSWDINFIVISMIAIRRITAYNEQFNSLERYINIKPLYPQ